MPKYFCGLCETSHHELKEAATCPECGRKYCIDSIQSALNVNKEVCPYCDTPFEWFPEVSISIKRRIQEKTHRMTTETTIPSKNIEIFTPSPELTQNLDSPAIFESEETDGFCYLNIRNYTEYLLRPGNNLLLTNRAFSFHFYPFSKVNIMKFVHTARTSRCFLVSSYFVLTNFAYFFFT